MTAGEIIEEIKRLDPKEQLGVIRFAYQLDAERKLSGNELSGLAERMVDTSNELEAARIRELIIRGFYGQRRDAYSAAKSPGRIVASSSRSYSIT